MRPQGRRSLFPVHQALLHPPPAFPRLWVTLQSLGCEGMFLQTTELCKPSQPPAELFCDIPRSQERRGSSLGCLETVGKANGMQREREKILPASKRQSKSSLFPQRIPSGSPCHSWWLSGEAHLVEDPVKIGPQKVISTQESTQQLFPLWRWSRTL